MTQDGSKYPGWWMGGVAVDNIDSHTQPEPWPSRHPFSDNQDPHSFPTSSNVRGVSQGLVTGLGKTITLVLAMPAPYQVTGVQRDGLGLCTGFPGAWKLDKKMEAFSLMSEVAINPPKCKPTPSHTEVHTLGLRAGKVPNP